MVRLALFSLLLAPTFALGADGGCDIARTTIEMNACVSHEVDLADAEMNRYLDAVRAAYAKDDATLSALEKAPDAWAAYKDAHCKAVYVLNRSGTVRGSQMLSCKLMLTRIRTHDLWLRYLSDDEPKMPEPVRQP
jgi:uncharacterized protein YecT (DUF1311 family)